MNCHAPAFIPRNSPAFAKSNATTGRLPQRVAASSPGVLNNYPTRRLNQAATTGHTQIDNADQGNSGQQQMVTSSTVATTATTPVASPKGDREVTAADGTLVQSEDVKHATPVQAKRQQQLVTTIPLISVEERKSLDAMVSSNPVIPTNHTVGSTGHMSRNRNKMQLTKQKQTDAMVYKSQEGNALVLQQFPQEIPNSINLGRDAYEEDDENITLNQLRAAAARKGDLSPFHSGKNRKSRTRDRSWDGRQHSYD